MKVTLIVLSVGFVLYVLWIALQFGIRKSISESYYVLEKTGHGYYFTFFMWFITGCLIAVIVNLGTDVSGAWSFFVAAIGAAFVGAATMYLQRMSGIVHFTGAVTLIFMSLLGIGLVFGNWHPMYFMGAIIINMIVFGKVIRIPNVIYWIEIVSFIAIITGLFIQ